MVHAPSNLRLSLAGDSVSYVRNCNINYTNICTHRCGFCAFAKSHAASTLRGPAYVLDADAVAERAHEAWQRGAREVCMQGGIHPHYDGNTYLGLTRAVKAIAPDMHIHAFSPLEGCTVRAPWVCRSTTMCCACARQAWALCPAPPPRSSTTRCVR